MMLDPKTVQVLFADLQPQIVARSKTNPPDALARSAAVLAQVARLLHLPMHLSVVPEGGQRPELIPELARETEGVVPGKLNTPVLLCDVGETDNTPEPPALKENAFKLSPAPPKKRLPFQYAGESHMPPTAPGSSCTICVSPVVQVVQRCPILPVSRLIK